MKLENLIEPDLEGIPVDEDAEPADAGVEHLQDGPNVNH